MEVLLDWTPRKRSHSVVDEHVVAPEDTSRDYREEVAAATEQPFAFVAAKKKRNRCRLACCTTYIMPKSSDLDPTQEVSSSLFRSLLPHKHYYQEQDIS